MNRRRTIDLLAALVLTLLLAWAVFSFLGRHTVFGLFSNDSASIREALGGIGPWASFTFMWLVVLEVLVAFIPGWVIYPIGAAAFGFWPALGLILFGNVIGSSISFWIGRRWGLGFLKRFIGEKRVAQFGEYMHRHGAWSVFLLKLNPLTSFDIWNYLAGISPMAYDRFILSNLLGILPLTALAVAAGEGGYRLAPWMVLIFGMLTVVYAVWFFVKLGHIRRVAGR